MVVHSYPKSDKNEILLSFCTFISNKATGKKNKNNDIDLKIVIFKPAAKTMHQKFEKW